MMRSYIGAALAIIMIAALLSGCFFIYQLEYGREDESCGALSDQQAIALVQERYNDGIINRPRSQNWGNYDPGTADKVVVNENGNVEFYRNNERIAVGLIHPDCYVGWSR